MAPDCLLLIFSIVFCLCSILSGALYRYKKYGIPLKDTLLMLWQEGIVDGFKECRANFIPTTKKTIGVLWEYSKKVYIAITAYLILKPVKHTFTPELYYGLQDAVSGYAYIEAFQPVIEIYNTPVPSYVYIIFYTKSAVTDAVKTAVDWAVKAKFQEYMSANNIYFPHFPVSYAQNNRIELYLYYCEFPTEYLAYKKRLNQIMQMKATPAFRPLIESDLPKTSNLVLGWSYDMWATTGQVVPILWDIASAPHIMVSGPTGGGKTVYVKLLLERLLAAGASVCVCDFKGHNDLREFVKDFAAGADCDACLSRFCVEFEKIREQGEDGKRRVLIFDEFGSYSASKTKKEYDDLMKSLANIIFMGRSYGFSVILVSQRFDAETIKTSYREQFAYKVYMGPTISQQSATILYPNSDLDKSARLPPCCGYISTPKTDLDTIIMPKVDISELDRRLKALGKNTQE